MTQPDGEEQTSQQLQTSNVEETLDFKMMKCSNLIQAAEVESLQHRIAQLERELETAKQCFAYRNINHSDKLVQHYTGLTAAKFNILLTFCCRFKFKFHDGWNVESVTKENQLFLTLIKLKLNLSHTDLGVRFAISRTTVSNIVTTWICLLHELLFKNILIKTGIPSIYKNQLSLPACFETFSNCRITLDCTEIQCAIPGNNMDSQSQTFSHYKQRNTFKVLVGVAPNGVITFVSDMYPGSTSDKAIVEHSNIMASMKPGDLILADKGFVMQDLVPQGVSVNVPPFLKNKRFTLEEVKTTKSIARARVHVERAIARIKNYSILEFIPVHYRSFVTKLFQVCACLVNMQSPILQEIDNIN